MNKNSFPLVSIALCTYNGEKYLREQLDSLVGQTYPNIEIVVTDDCSKDNTVSILNEYASKANIRVIVNEHNLGFIKNFEKCISLCKGDYITLSDQDDVWDLDKIRLLMENLNDNILIYSDSELIDDTGQSLNRKLSDKRNLYRGNDFKPFIFNNCVSGHAVLFRKELTKYIFPFPPDIFHDWWITFVATIVGKIDYLEVPLDKYRQHPDTSTDILGIRRSKTSEKVNEERREKLERRLNMMVKWLTILKNCQYLKQDQQEFLEKLIKAYLGKRNSLFSGSLFLLLMSNINSLFYIHHKPLQSKLAFIFKESIGFRSKEI